MLPIIVDGYTQKGVVVHFMCSVLLIPIAYVLGGMLSSADSLCSDFKSALLYTLIVDLAAVQPVIMLLALGYRWMTASDDCDALYSELHPCHHEVREC